MEERIKAKIVKIGTIVDNRPFDWEFDCGNGAIGELLSINEGYYEEGVINEGIHFYGGYSIKELIEIAKKNERKE